VAAAAAEAVNSKKQMGSDGQSVTSRPGRCRKIHCREWFYEKENKNLCGAAFRLRQKGDGKWLLWEQYLMPEIRQPKSLDPWR
jgi:hypothetical protein